MNPFIRQIFIVMVICVSCTLSNNPAYSLSPSLNTDLDHLLRLMKPNPAYERSLEEYLWLKIGDQHIGVVMKKTSTGRYEYLANIIVWLLDEYARVLKKYTVPHVLPPLMLVNNEQLYMIEIAGDIVPEFYYDDNAKKIPLFLQEANPFYGFFGQHKINIGMDSGQDSNMRTTDSYDALYKGEILRWKHFDYEFNNINVWNVTISDKDFSGIRSLLGENYELILREAISLIRLPSYQTPDFDLRLNLLNNLYARFIFKWLEKNIPTIDDSFQINFATPLENELPLLLAA